MSFQTYSQNISARKILKFALLPDFKSRFQYLGQSLSFFVAFFASFFNMAGLIPNNHPCLRVENVGKYGFRDIIGIAYGNLRWKMSYLPQIMMFFAVIVSFVMAIVLIGTSVFYYLVSYAHAQSIFSLSSSQPQEGEYALQFLARVFGNTGIGAFDPNEDGAGYSWLTVALQKMLALYSEAIMVIGGFIVFYYIITVIVESAQTGKPLGSRFSVWAPARLAIAIMMLVPVPMAGGYNGGQLIIFQVMSWGSNLATNLWVTGLSAYGSQCNTNTLENCMVGDPHTSNNLEFIRGVFLITGCQVAYNAKMEEAGYKASVWDTLTLNENAIAPWVHYDNALKVTIYSYGTKKDKDYCGSYQVPWNTQEYTADLWDDGQAYTYTPPGGLVPQNIGANEGSNLVRKGYIEAYNSLFDSGSNNNVVQVASDIVVTINPGDTDIIDELYTQDWLDRHVIYDWATNYQTQLDNYVAQGVAKQNLLADAVLSMGSQGGWANAGAFFITLSNLNGGVQSALSNGPSIVKLPEILTEPHITPTGIDPENKTVVAVHEMMKKMAKWWNDYPLNDNTASELDMYGMGKLQSASPDDVVGMAGSIDSNSLFSYFTGSGLNRMLFVSNTLNPLGELMTLGGWITNISLLALITGAVFTAVKFLSGLGLVLMGVAGLFLAMGVALWIILPALPFFYFTFGVVNWVIAVFEAIIAAPLWALSFLKIDGAGLPAGGMNGIYLIFLLFIHPTLMILGLVGSILVFSASVSFLNMTFSLAVAGITADRLLGGVSGFFYIIVYVIIVYMLGQSSFKMIDTIPKKIVRFMGKGGGPDPFSEIGTDPKELESHTLYTAAVLTSLGKQAERAKGSLGGGVSGGGDGGGNGGGLK